MARPRKGQLLQRQDGGYSARVTDPNTGKRRMVDLGTTLKVVALARLADLVANPETPPTALAAGAVETFEQAARRIVMASTIKRPEHRLSRLARYAFPQIGRLPVTEIRSGHIYGILRGAAGTGALTDLSHTSVGHLKNDLSAVFSVLHAEDVILENPAKRARLQDVVARHDGRPRAVLSDAEFAQFMAWPALDPELRALAMVSRTLGGARTSDLRTLGWQNIDTAAWTTAIVLRPKTKHKGVVDTKLAIPEMLVPTLQVWHVASGRPKTGLVFPCDAEQVSHARRLRSALWAAGVRRGATRKTCELQTDNDATRKVDFHSFRRAYCTGLAVAGASVQTAMALAGHRSPNTHVGYVLRNERLETPAAALPRLTHPGASTPSTASNGAPASEIPGHSTPVSAAALPLPSLDLLAASQNMPDRASAQLRE